MGAERIGLPVRRRSITIVLILAACQLVALSSVWPRFQSPNEWSRVAAARAVVLDATWSVDRQVQVHGLTEDLAAYAGRLYSDKAPGTIWLAVPVVAAVHAVAPNASPRTDQYVCRVALSTLPSLVAAWIVTLWVASTVPHRRHSSAVACILLFGTGFGVYAGLFFAHAIAGALLVVGAWLLLGRDDLGVTAPRPALAWSLGAAAAALAAVSEYQAALPAAAILVLGVWRRWRRVPWVIAGALPPAAGFAAYNAACFGAPWSLSHRHYAGAYSDLSSNTLLGFGCPSLDALSGLLVSPLVGLLFFSPLLVPALLSPALARRRGYVRTAVLLATTVWLMPVVMAGYGNWHAGASFGPRYLVAVIPFWVVGTFLVLGSDMPVPFVGASVASMVVHWLGRVTPPFAIDSDWVGSTLRAWALPCLLNGRWNLPPGDPSVIAGVLGLGMTAAIWLAVMGYLILHLPPRRRWLGVTAAALILAAQLGLGRVTDRQRAWWDYTESWFSVGRTESVDNVALHAEDAAGRSDCHATFEKTAIVEIHGR